jgi:exopolysaccharide production protein ExoZ
VTQRIDCIQYLRAFAALAVVVYHSAERSGLHFGIGAAGVDVFFVISGFIMWTVTRGKPVGAATFIRHRLLRIVPLYWLVTLTLACVALAMPSAFPALQPKAGHVIASMLFIPHMDGGGHPWPLVVAGWTLVYEMFFYAVFAASLLAPRHLQIGLVTAVLLACVAAGVALAPSQPWLETYTNPLLLEFLAGIWIGELWRQERVPGPAIGMALLVAGLACYATLESKHFYLESARLALWGMPAMLLVVGMLACEGMVVMRRARLLLILGDASYAIYLVHGLLISGLGKLLGGVAPALLLPIFVVGAGVVGVAVHFWVERPMTAILRRGLRQRAALRTA